jgi:hypothetical protein
MASHRVLLGLEMKIWYRHNNRPARGPKCDFLWKHRFSGTVLIFMSLQYSLCTLHNDQTGKGSVNISVGHNRPTPIQASGHTSTTQINCICSVLCPTIVRCMCSVFYTALFCCTLHCPVVHCIVLFYSALSCCTLHCPIVHCIVLFCTALSRFTLHCPKKSCV